MKLTSWVRWSTGWDRSALLHPVRHRVSAWHFSRGPVSACGRVVGPLVESILTVGLREAKRNTRGRAIEPRCRTCVRSLKAQREAETGR